MRHVYIRGMMGLIWMAAAVTTGIFGSFEMAVFYVVLACLCFMEKRKGQRRKIKWGSLFFQFRI